MPGKRPPAGAEQVIISACERPNLRLFAEALTGAEAENPHTLRTRPVKLLESATRFGTSVP
jgi:hypothetical protein